MTVRGNVLYGTISQPCGTVYQLTHSGSDWQYSTLAALPNNCGPNARVVFGPDGHIYGTSGSGGRAGGGTVFKLTPPVGTCRTVACYWTITDLHDFNFDTEGYDPGNGDLIWDQQGISTAPRSTKVLRRWHRLGADTFRKRLDRDYPLQFLQLRRP